MIIYPTLPEIVPIHLDSAGKANGFSGKSSLLIEPLISTIIYIGLTFLNKYPHIYNYPVQINESNAVHYYTNGSRMIRYLKLSVTLVFLFVLFEIIYVAKNGGDTMGIWSWMIPLAIIFLPQTYFIIKSFRLKKTVEN